MRQKINDMVWHWNRRGEDAQVWVYSFLTVGFFIAGAVFGGVMWGWPGAAVCGAALSAIGFGLMGVMAGVLCTDPQTFRGDFVPWTLIPGATGVICGLMGAGLGHWPVVVVAALIALIVTACVTYLGWRIGFAIALRPR